MIHLPKNGTRVKVWPDPKRKVAASAPRADAGFIPDMPADGMTVTWDEFRYHQYLAGDIHLFDPETGKGESYDFEHPHHEHNLEFAAKHWKCHRGDWARKHLAELEAKRAAAAEQEKAKAVMKVAPADHIEKTAIEMIDGKGELHEEGEPGKPMAAPLDTVPIK